jgi:hypothetical protein
MLLGGSPGGSLAIAPQLKIACSKGQLLSMGWARVRTFTKQAYPVMADRSLLTKLRAQLSKLFTKVW